MYGRRKLWKAALRAGIEAGRDQVARLMKQRGLRGGSRAKKRFTTHADAGHLRAPDLVKRNFTATRPDALWVADFTCCSTWSGVIYIAFIIDVFSRRLVGWKASRSMTAPLVVDALNMAAWTRRHQSLDGLVCHTDIGSQYTSIAYTERLAEIGAAPSIGTRRRCRHRGRDRQANRSLRLIAVCRLRYDQRPISYMDCRQAERPSKMDVVGCLKRFIAREVLHDLVNDIASRAA